MRIAILSPIAWRTPPRHYGPWESIASHITEGLVERGHDVTLYATADSLTNGTLKSVCPRGYEEDSDIIPKVWESLHIAKAFEEADQYDIVHNHFDFLPLTYSGMTETPLVTTIHGFSSPGILPVYEKYDEEVHYVSISNSDRASSLHYTGTVHHGIEIDHFRFRQQPDDYLLFFGRIHPDKGAHDAIKIARESNRRLVLAGIIQDQEYFDEQIKDEIDGNHIEFVGSVGPKKRNSLLGNASALLHPIYFDEPFGLSVIESMACGTPVIAYHRGSMPELIENGTNGFLAENIEEAVESVNRLKTISRSQCRQHVEQFFTVDRMVDDYEQIYESILDKEEGRQTALLKSDIQ
ncbi:glycosyltransferase family 4 protein [Fodinibius sediminis]|uniref:Mannose-6-phosphate isomerase, type 2 n=1 Tax=Fodinibius sediminis TaxID=1214077 RepID=A0A521BDJ3_9BACT|nr:glycosyltransferase family 4 protein [Fodinibius sediminis]SMO45129.1 mannose-6-phosphate isomerase, type 2 [Fodinibius sediminis]